MNKTEALSDALIHVADKLGYTTQKVFEVYTQAQTALAIKKAVIMVPSLALALATAYGLYSTILKEIEVERSVDPFDKFIALTWSAVGALLVYGFAFIILDITFGEVIMRLMAPEYMAIEQLMNKIPGAT